MYRLNRKSEQGKGKVMRKLLPLLIAAIVVAAAAIIVLQTADNKKLDTAREQTSAKLPEDLVEINGVKCVPKKNIQTYLFMGVDARGETKKMKEYDGTGQVDTLQLVVIDQQAGTYTRLPINRDTITNVNVLDDEGYYLSTRQVQISLAHSMGDGMERSCENTIDAVSGLLYNQPIDGYASLNMDAIETLNHLADGVTVTIEDDFSKVDSSLVKGATVKLTDEQAMYYVRGRMGVGDGSNEGRMRRQTRFLAALKPILVEKCQQDSAFALEIYDALEPYMVTDLNRNSFIKLAAELVESEEQDSVQIDGTNQEGDTGFNEFTPDKDSLAEAVIHLFYDIMEDEDGTGE